MTAIEILASLRAQGVQVSVCDGRLRLVGAGVLPDALCDEIEARRHELIAAQLVADGRDILAALADRGIVVRLAEDGRAWADQPS